MDPRFMIDRNGKQFVVYAGLLDEAHAQGLAEITTAIVQVPTPENQQVAIVQAIATMEYWDDRTESYRKRNFYGIGDASPNNVAKPMATCLIRFAETRAKARALRDAINIGVASLEEMGEDDDAPRPAAAAPRTARQANTAAKPVSAPPAGETIPQVFAREEKEFKAFLVAQKWTGQEIAGEFKRMVPGPSIAEKLTQLREWRAQMWPAAEPK